MILPPNTFLFMEGEPGDQMYIIRKGLVRISKREGSHTATLAELGSGSILGEMSLLDQQPRSATAKTLEATEVVVIDQTMLANTYKSLPAWLTSIIRMVVQRLREATARKYQDDLYTALPSLLFLLNTQYSEFARIQVEKLADQLKTLYGLSFFDFHKTLQALVQLDLVRIIKSESGKELLEVTSPQLLLLCYRSFIDKASPTPTREHLLSEEETQALQCLLEASQNDATTHGDKKLVQYSQIRAILESKAPELASQPQHWANLCLAQRIEIVPLLQADQAISDNHQVAFVPTQIESIVALQRVLRTLTEHFFEKN